MINILYLHAGAEMYGADKVLLQLVSNLDRTKFNPIVVLPNEGVLKEKLIENNVRTTVIPYPILRRKYFNVGGIIKYIAEYFKSCRLINEYLKKNGIKIGIIHVNTMAVLEGIMLKKRLKAKLLWHVHEIIVKPRLVFKVLCFFIGKYADKCVAVSMAVSNHLLGSNLVNKDKIQVIYNGVDSTKFNSNIKTGYLFDEFKVSRNSIRVGMIGRVNSWKGQDDFLDATTDLLGRFPNLYLFIIGSAFEGEEWRVIKLKKRINETKFSERIVFSEFRNDINAIHNFFDIFVLPSTNPDPLPTVVLEAMASGKPIIGYRHGGIKEMVEEGYNGFLVNPRDSQKLKEILKKILNNTNQRKKLGYNSLKKQKAEFSLVKFYNSFSEIYVNLSE
ncbi:glycosyltransferase family 4 protein [Liquorilactobacillus mali]|uniref:glycosyltransferase family 4 protein n=1 Tax=Liquorilactobacillus mali TaxID=1618 RepID=UPI000249168D|nr:glycosyltransferase family 4 protein [Liquorilactobacillus mali]QFQ74439.1 glycosyltransferase family 4 protein [Liquorilactobacillus mali]